MSSQFKRAFSFAVVAAIFFTAGVACNKLGNGSAVSDREVVAMVGDHKITFGDWMQQMDLLRVFASASVNPDNAEQVKAVLDSLIDQQLVLDAAQKAHYMDATFDEAVKKKLVEADLKVKEIKDKLEKDIATVRRMEKNYQDAYKKMLLARQFANSQVENVVVTEKDIRDLYNKYADQAVKTGQKLPPYDKVKKELKPSVQAEKFLSNLQVGSKVDRKQEVIDKYLHSLSESRQMLDSSSPMVPGAELPSKKK